MNTATFTHRANGDLWPHSSDVKVTQYHTLNCEVCGAPNAHRIFDKDLISMAVCGACN